MVSQTTDRIFTNDDSERLESIQLLYNIDIAGIVTNDIENFFDSNYILIRDAHFVGRLANLAVRGSTEFEISIPNAIVKIFAPSFYNEKGQLKSGEINEIKEIDDASITELLEEASDIVGKYALGIERVAEIIDNPELQFRGFAEKLANALGFDYEDVLAAFIVKYDSRFRIGKNKEAELNAIEKILENRYVKRRRVEGTLAERLEIIKNEFNINEILQSVTNEEVISLQNISQDSLYIKITSADLGRADKKRDIKHESGLWLKQYYSYWEV